MERKGKRSGDARDRDTEALRKTRLRTPRLQQRYISATEGLLERQPQVILCLYNVWATIHGRRFRTNRISTGYSSGS
jgi:hypothetical protein